MRFFATVLCSLAVLSFICGCRCVRNRSSRDSLSENTILLDITGDPKAGKYDSAKLTYFPTKDECSSCDFKSIDKSAAELAGLGIMGEFKDLRLGLSLNGVADWVSSNHLQFIKGAGAGYRRSFTPMRQLECEEDFAQRCEISIETARSNLPTSRIDVRFYRGYAYEIRVIFSPSVTKGSRLSFIKEAIQKFGVVTSYDAIVVRRDGRESTSSRKWYNDDIHDGKYCNDATNPGHYLLSIEGLRWENGRLLVALADISSDSFPGEAPDCDRFGRDISQPDITISHAEMSAVFKKLDSEKEKQNVTHPF